MNNKIYLIGLLLPCFVWASSHSATVDNRQQAFSSIEEQLDAASDLIDGKDTDWTQLESTATQLLAASETLKHSFPQGSSEGSKASEKIWQDPAKFQQLMMQMDQGIAQLYQASQQRDTSMAEDGIDKAEDTCRSCHRSYRSR